MTSGGARPRKFVRANATAPNWLAKTSDDGTGCYVHLPFCDRICPYCDFAVVEYRQELAARYLRALITEIRRWRESDARRANVAGAKSGTSIQTLYFGGGTPSALPVSQLAQLAHAIFESFGVAPGSIEFTLEANPSRNIADLPAWRAMGVNRLSIGAQSFDDSRLRRLGRAHDAQQIREFAGAARAAGFDNLGLDLIAGAPGETMRSFERSLDEALQQQPSHLSVYALTIEEGTPYARWHARDSHAFPGDDEVASLLELADRRLTAAGMTHYEISNFARPGFESAHNWGYWRQRNCVAFGASAAGYCDGLRYANVRETVAYCQAIEAGKSAVSFRERLPRGARIGEAAMLALRTDTGIDYEDFEHRFGLDPRAAFACVIEKCKRDGLLEEHSHGARLTRSGRLLANTACARFLEPAGEASA
jgi:oxygen-independent coproporphyrinogen-3 oxidase